MAAMPTISDVIEALSSRAGVKAALVLGRDGLPIDSRAVNGVDSESLAAMVPAVISAFEKLGDSAEQGTFGTGVAEFGGGIAVLTVLTPEVILALFMEPNTNVGPLLHELYQHRSNIAALL